MVLLKDLTEYLDEILAINSFTDASNNGLQVQGNDEIKKVAVCVDACMESFEKAKDADLIICHHGISWKDSLKYVTGMNYERIAFLIKNDIGLYAAHLPLDAHPELGNNIILVRGLELENVLPFGLMDGNYIGFKGKLKEPVSLESFKETIENYFGNKCDMLHFGNDEIREVGIISGKAGSQGIIEAKNEKLDLFITGEIEHSSYHLAKENGMNVIAAGHYDTETLGVKALAKNIEEKFGVECMFVDSPTRM